MSEEGRILVAGGPVERRVNHIIIGLAGFLVGAVAGFVVLLMQIHGTAVSNCRQIELVKSGLAQTLEESQRFAASSPVRSQAQRERVVRFYRDALGRLKPRDC